MKNSTLKKSAKSNKHIEEKRVDDTVIAAICGLDLFIAQANSASLGTMARILTTAKEELIYWSVNMGYHETTADKFINKLLYNNSMFAAADFIEKLSTIEAPEKIKSISKKSEISIPSFKPLKDARENSLQF